MIIISREGLEVLLLQAKGFLKSFREVWEIRILWIIKTWDQNKEISARAHSVQVYRQLYHLDREAYMTKIQLENNFQEILAARVL